MRILVKTNNLELFSPPCRAWPGAVAALVKSMGEALHLLEVESFDLVIYTVETDKDAADLRTVVKAAGQAPTIALVALDSPLTAEAQGSGAAFVLDARAPLPSGFGALVSLKKERDLLAAELMGLKNAERAELETAMFFERLARGAAIPVAEESYGGKPLSQGAPEVHDQFVRRFIDVLELALDGRMYKVEHNLSEPLRNLAEDLGFLRAGPRDLVDVFTTAVDNRKSKVGDVRHRAYVDEGRLLLLELMGRLVSFYRRFSLGVRPKGARSALKR